MTELQLGNVTIELTTGDIARQEGFDAVVNAANAELQSGGGVAGALHRAAGPGLAEEASRFAPIRPGQAVITAGHGLSNAHVIHCLGPVFGKDTPSDKLLASCYREALRLAEDNEVVAVAFPAISTGAFGYPPADAARVALRTIVELAPELRSIRRVRFVLHDESSLGVHQSALEEIARGLRVRGALRGEVAVVTGASRGAGAAIAAALGEAGATVYVTGRSSRESSRTEGLPGTIEDVADEVAARGGVGIPVRVDHTHEAEVEALFDRVRQEANGLDLLVNNAWGGYERYGDAPFTAPFWEQPLWRWEGMYTSGVRAHLVASRLAAPLLIERGSGLIVSTIAWAYGEYLGNVIYDSAKAAVIRMSYGMAQELRPHGVAAIALAPGWMRTERIMAAHAQQPFDLGATESPAYLGRAVVALATDPEVMEKSGSVLTVGDLAREYGFTDVDGRQPPGFRFGGG